MLPAQPNQSIISGMNCLEEIVSLVDPIGSRELARVLGEEHTKVNRILGTLCHLGYVEKTESNKYKTGPAIHIMASLTLTSSKLLHCAIEPLKDLLKTEQTVALGVLWKQKVSYIFHGNHTLPFEKCIGSHELFPEEKSSIGSIIRVFNKTEKLSASDKKIIKNGYCSKNASENDVSLAVPIGNSKIIAGLALAGNPKKFNHDKNLQYLLDAANKINTALNK
jgi:DNA-binding IclR family transcriptional regulator